MRAEGRIDEYREIMGHSGADGMSSSNSPENEDEEEEEKERDTMHGLEESETNIDE